MPTVSVVIPAYNQASFLGAAVHSVLAQTFPDYEAIIVDDGSTDNTPQVAAEFTDPRVRYLRQHNCGLSAARNTGIRNAVGELISFLDSDDLFFPDKLAVLVDALRARSDWGMVAGQSILIDEHGQSLGRSFATPLPEQGAQLLLWNPLHVGSVLLRRGWLDRVGVFDETLRSYEDWDMWLRLARAGCRFGWVDRPVSLYRIHRAQMTRKGDQMTRATFAVLDKVFADPDLPADWAALRDQAYAHAYLRAAAHAYQTCSFERACAALEEAIRLDPQLAANGAERIKRRIAAWADDPRTPDGMNFLESVYANLPATLGCLRRRRGRILGQAATQYAFEAFARGDVPRARALLMRSFRYWPAWLANRGAWSMLARSLFAR
ncbi:MAG: glycosyltransferase [Anaerolineae bacterium]|nr:glycosyltransferase [Thermoflexales bacterium]MDW8408725.1 glycosyltransferase [Anaerolineae bacterium]